MEGTTATADPPNGGLDRRQLIKRAAVAGMAAWTAPVIVESLTSPAAAATGVVGPGTYLFYFQVLWNSTTACSVTLLSTAAENNFNTNTCGGTRVQCGNVGDTIVTALFYGTATPIDGCSGATAACPTGSGSPTGPNQGLCFSTTQGHISGFDASALNAALNPPPGSGAGAGYGCLSGGACTFGTGLETFHPTNNNPNGTTAIVAIQVTVP